MSNKKIKTINLQGKAYAQVKDRVREFRNDHSQGEITTSYEFTEQHLIIKATVLREATKPEAGIATGHAFGKIGAVKAFEKLESVAVGRALAFLGYGADGEIASYDEMVSFDDALDVAGQIEVVKKELKEIKTIDEITQYYNKKKGSDQAIMDLIIAKGSELRKEGNENS